jgi:hypothetical protein
MTRSHLLLSLAAAAALAACSSSDPAPADESKHFDQMSHEEQEEYMEHVVLPQMGPLLTAFDGERFAQVDCKTCHGPDPEAVHFEMPNADLPKLDSAESFAGHEPDMVKMMMDSFSPKMAELLHEEPWSPDNQDGFGCFSCHTPM